MRLLTLTPLLFLLSPTPLSPLLVSASADSGLYPPGLLPLINKANILLSTGQFGEAAKVYSEAIDQSPADYLLYYKRATAYFSMQRHSSALEDFEKVLSLTSNTFDNAHLMKARIHTREGAHALARASLTLYIKAKGKDKEAEELEGDLTELERVREKTEKERNAGLWNACVESASQTLRVASHDVEVRKWRAECALGAGDVESAVGDLTRLSHLLPPSTHLLTHIFRLAFFYLPSSPTPMATLKQCLHFDPDSKPCLTLHRLVKAFDKSFISLDELIGKDDWRAVLKLLTGPGKKADLWNRWEEAMNSNVGEGREGEVLPLVPEALLKSPSSSSATPTSTSTEKPRKKKQQIMPIHLPNAAKVSPRRQTLVRAMCKAYTHLSDLVKASTEYPLQMDKWCSELLTLEGCEEDVAGLVGKAEGLLKKEEWEEAVRVLDKAFEASGRSDRDIHNRLQRAQKKLKQSKQKDYYKILGVSRDADAKTVKKAFRKMAKEAHPDKGGSEAKMAALNEAYEVISNPELRQRFDNGEDPMDPNAGQGNPWAGGAGGHPFAQFFQQQGGGHGFPGSGFQGGFPGGGFPGGGRSGGGGFQFHFGH
ncbi:hypothetical protein BJ165DRAFT_1503016 [Panaeolus papilionaceus]|nr:hypothetical protein BJ165DRAFT_1503016 [Panaeolus papilionaceus]